MVTSLVPSIAHRLQLCQDLKVYSLLLNTHVISPDIISGNELAHQDVLGITADVTGIILNVTRSLVYSLL